MPEIKANTTLKGINPTINSVNSQFSDIQEKKIVSHSKTEKKLNITDLWGNASQVALVIKNLLVNTGDTRDADLILGLGRSPGERQGNPLQYSCLENPMDRGAWWATVQRVAESDMTKMSAFVGLCVRLGVCVSGEEGRQKIDKTIAKFFPNFIKTIKL